MGPIDAPASPRDLPSVDRVLRSARAAALAAAHGPAFVAAEARALLDGLRAQAVAGSLGLAALKPGAVDDALAERCRAALAPHLREVLNLTGTVLHSNLGRARLADAAVERIVATARGACALEFDLATGGRGDRDDAVEALLCRLTGAEAATVVNNNAAAVLLTVAASAAARPGANEVVVSRGELVEIGGAFRMPDVMAAAGATLVEVGTTNRTHPQDYERAIGERTALVMKVHASNYEVRGFTRSVGEAELAAICRARGVLLVSDLGSGALVDLAAHGLPREPLPREQLAAGCDVVTFSGDKLLGGPQAGLIVGSREAVGRIRRFPMKRALRISKLPLAALEATLALHLRPDRLAEDLPTLRLLTRPVAAIRALAEALAPPVAAAVAPRYAASVVALASVVGSGSLPVETLPSAGVAVEPHGAALDALARAFRSLPVPVIGRIADGRLLLDLRCLEDPAPFVSQLGALRELLR